MFSKLREKDDSCIFVDGKCRYSSSNMMETTKKMMKYGFILYGIFVALLSVSSYFFGLSIGVSMASGYVALSLSLAVILLASAIPFAGTVFIIGYQYVTSQLMTLLGVMHNFWVDAFMISFILAIGIFIQVFSSSWTSYLIYDQFSKKKFENV